MGNGGEVRVVPVADRAGLEEFIRLPWRIYQNDPYWVPPLIPIQREFLDPRRGPFFEIGEAQYFLAYLGDQPAGRISAHINRAYDARHGPEAGFFGFFESVQDERVAAGLFDAAAAWLGARGKKRFYGPLNFSIYDEMGLLVEGFDSMPAFLQTHNPPYYLDLFTAQGFKKTLDWYALRANARDPVLLATMKQKIQQIMSANNLVFAPFHPRELERRAEEVFNLFNESWEPNWGHVPLTRGQFHLLLEELKPLLRPELVNLIMDGDRLVAFSVTVPDLNPVIQKLNGRLNWWGKLRLFYAAKYAPLRKLRALVLGVTQRYQTRRLHHVLVMNTYLYLSAQPTAEIVDLSLIPENLRHYLKALHAFGCERYKTFRVLEREI